MIIRHNVYSMGVLNKIEQHNVNNSKVLNHVSSGQRINRAGDDASGASISEKMRAQVRGLHQANRNIQDGVSLVHVAEAALQEVHSYLQRSRELAIQASNDTVTAGDRAEIQKEIDQILQGISEIANNTEFNGLKLLDGSMPINYYNPDALPIFDFKDVLNPMSVDAAGKFMFRSAQGYPGTNLDDNATLIYDMSYTTFPSIRIGNNSYYIHKDPATSALTSGVTIKQPTTNVGNTYTTIFNVSDPLNNVDVDVTQTVRIVEDKYEIRYDMLNNGPIAQDIGFLFNLDTKLGNDDTAPFRVDGLTVNNETEYTSGTMPSNFIVYNGNAGFDELQAEGILKDTGNFNVLIEPDKFGIGQWTDVDKWDWTASGGAILDSAYSIWWNQRSINTGETLSLNTFYGMGVPPTVDDPTDDLLEQYQLILQVGPNSKDHFLVMLSDVRTSALGMDNLKLDSYANSQSSLQKIDDAIKKVSSERSKYGSYQNALEHIDNNVFKYSANLTAAESQIRDTDMAKSTLSMTKNNILIQAAQSILAQSNQMPGQVLNLLK